MILFEIAS